MVTMTPWGYKVYFDGIDSSCKKPYGDHRVHTPLPKFMYTLFIFMKLDETIPILYVHLQYDYLFHLGSLNSLNSLNSQVKVDVQKRALRFREKQLDNRCLNRFIFSSIAIKW